MSGMMRHRPPIEEAAVAAVAAELARRGWSANPTSSSISGVDLYVFWPYSTRRLAVRVLGNPRFDRRGRPEWLIGVWRFQSRPRTERGMPFFRHPLYPGFWVLWDFPAQCDFNVFVWQQDDPETPARFFIVPTDVLRQWLSEAPAWAEDYHGVRDRPSWVSLDVASAFEGQWELIDD